MCVYVCMCMYRRVTLLVCVTDMCTGCKRQFVIYDVHADVIRMCMCVWEVILFSCDVRLGGSNVNVCKRKYTDLVACDVKL